MSRRLSWLVFLSAWLAVFGVTPRVGWAREGGFVGLDLGVSEPTNDNYRSHVQTGAVAAPYGGYMFNDYLGLQGQFQFLFQEPDNDNRRFVQPGLDHETQTTTMGGLTVGPRLQVPLGDVVSFYATGQGGGFKGFGGAVNQWAPGFSVGGGLDFALTDTVSIGLFGRWNRAYMAPHPTFLVNQAADDQGPKDIRWATGGVGFKYSFPPEAPPRPAPPPVVAREQPPAPPVKKKIVLRSVHFDFDKAVIRSDARPVLDEAATVLSQEKDVNLVIVEGHTDSRGTDAYNLSLSNRRADAVRDYLVKKGIAESRIRTEGLGEAQPVASNDTDEGRAQNRRVELNIK